MNILLIETGTLSDSEQKIFDEIKSKLNVEFNNFGKDAKKEKDIIKVIEHFDKNERQSVIYFLTSQFVRFAPTKRNQIKKLIELGNTKYSTSKDDVFNALIAKLFKGSSIKDQQELTKYGIVGVTFIDAYEEDLTGKKVTHGVYLPNKEMTTLYGAPLECTQGFDVNGNELTSLEYAPRKIGDNFNCSTNKLKSLEYIPPVIPTDLSIDENPKLKSLKGLKSVGGRIYMEDTGFKSKDEIIGDLIKNKISVDGAIFTDFGSFKLDSAVIQDYKNRHASKKIGKFKDFLDL